MSKNITNENAVYKEAAKVSGLIFLFGLIEFIILTAFLSFRRDILIGVLYGCLVASLSFFYLAYSVKKSVEKGEKGAQVYMTMSYNSRLLITAAAVIIAAKVESIHLWAAVVPLIFQRVAVYIISVINSHSNKGSENS